MNGISNIEIIDFLEVASTTDEFYASESDKAYLKNYDACDDYVLTDSLIHKIWKDLQAKFNGLDRITKIVNPINILHTNAGTGKVLSECPSDNVMITAMNNDYICKMISDILNQKFSVDFNYSSEISDLSHFYINGDNGNNQKFDLIFTQPSENNYYKGIDGTNLENLAPLEYYSSRSLDFLTKGGYLCVLTHPRKFNILKNNKSFKGKFEIVSEIVNKERFEEYGCLICKKK